MGLSPALCTRDLTGLFTGNLSAFLEKPGEGCTHCQLDCQATRYQLEPDTMLLDPRIECQAEDLRVLCQSCPNIKGQLFLLSL